MISMVFGINRIYKKLFNIYISVFRWGQGRREIIFRRWEQKPLQVLVGKKTVCNDITMAASKQQKRYFSRGLA